MVILNLVQANRVLEYCYKMFTISKEQYYIYLLEPEYNFCFKAGSSIGRITKKKLE